MNELVSLIIPVYNAEKFLEKCLNSLLKQTYNNIQIVLVNDGSNDNSLQICEDFAKDDKRINIINKENAGPSKARESGVKAANGDYIMFTDADDYVEENFVEKLLKVASKGYDIVQCSYNMVSITGEIIKSVTLNEQVTSGRLNASFSYASQQNTTNFLWNRIFRKKLFKGIIFPGLFAGEDSCILVQLYGMAESTMNITDSLYNYVMTPNSLTRDSFSEYKMDNITAGEFMYTYYERTFPELKYFSAIHICSYASRLYCEAVLQTNLNNEKHKEKLARVFNDYYPLTHNKKARDNSSKKRMIFIEMFNFNRQISLHFYKLSLKKSSCLDYKNKYEV